ncbi:hypothetical protein Pfo_001750, partial [Paulownia fortunei]
MFLEVRIKFLPNNRGLGFSSFHFHFTVTAVSPNSQARCNWPSVPSHFPAAAPACSDDNLFYLQWISLYCC